ncbi:hypothetical protein [Streptomyces sp. NPDC040750]|uniref:hypothetical protein n=1 Tax=Streptomyces sp. NPDC040750 TaxID=3154491 RepID=UPI00340587C1
MAGWGRGGLDFTPVQPESLPPTLPASVQQAMDDNGGALNLNATTSATTSSGVQVLGAGALTAVPPSSTTALVAGSAATAAEAIDDGHTVALPRWGPLSGVHPMGSIQWSQLSGARPDGFHRVDSTLHSGAHRRRWTPPRCAP